MARFKLFKIAGNTRSEDAIVKHKLLQKLIRVRPNGGGDTEIFYVQNLITAPSLQIIDRHGRSFVIPDGDYPIAKVQEAADYWQARAGVVHRDS